MSSDLAQSLSWACHPISRQPRKPLRFGDHAPRFLIIRILWKRHDMVSGCSFSLPLAPSLALLLLKAPLPRMRDAAALATVDEL